jgi:hypothetical protein
MTATLSACAFALALGGCSGGDDVDLEAARDFDAYPLYWAGERFEEWDVSHIELREGGFSTIVYGTCTPPHDLDEPSCTPPMQIQVQPLCAQLSAVTRAPIWKRRRIRGAPVGTIDGAPVLLTRGAQVKVYRGEDADEDAPGRVLEALRSLNGVEPVVGPDDEIPAAPAAVLSGARRCYARRTMAKPFGRGPEDAWRTGSSNKHG